jgi:hypothetical protein
VRLVASAEDWPLVDGAVPDGFSVAFGAEPADGATVRFSATRVAAGEVLVAPDGADLWRRSPWPAADALFAMALPAPDAPTLVVSATTARRDEAVAALRDLNVEALGSDRLRRADLERAGTVVFLEAAGFPVLLPAAAAAGRLVAMPETEPLFGWQDGIDCLVAKNLWSLTTAVTAATRQPRAFDPLRAMARLAARPYRASALYARLALDVSLGVGVGRP